MNIVNNDKMTRIVSVVLTVIFGVLFISLVANAVTTVSGTTITLENSETITNGTNGTITLTADVLKLVGTASTSAIMVGDEANATTINGLVSGYCTAPSVSVTATSTGTLLCASATGVVSGDRVFVTATSSLAGHFTITAASTTADGIIQIRVFNEATTTADSGTDATGINSFWFWAVR